MRAKKPAAAGEAEKKNKAPDQPTTRLTVDAIIQEGDRIILIRRNNPPFKGRWALPGGFVEYGETAEKACVREAREETGLRIRLKRLTGVYSKMGRDPRGHTVSVVFLAEGAGEPKGGSDAGEARHFSLNKLPPLAFDHKKIIEDAKKWCLKA